MVGRPAGGAELRPSYNEWTADVTVNLNVSRYRFGSIRRLDGPSTRRGTVSVLIDYSRHCCDVVTNRWYSDRIHGQKPNTLAYMISNLLLSLRVKASRRSVGI